MSTALDPMWNLTPGSELIIGGSAWQIKSCLPQLGRVTLVDEDGETWKTSLSELMHRPDCRPSTRTRKDLPAADRGRQPKAMDDLVEHEREIVMLRMEHLREVETGFRSGDPFDALPHEPRPQYDPDTTTLTQRRHAKARELRKAAAEAPAQAKANGLHRASVRTLIRWDIARAKYGPIGVADNRWLREATGRAISPEVREALFAVYAESSDRRSKLTMRDKERLIHQYVREVFDSAGSEPADGEATDADPADVPRVEIPGTTPCGPSGRSGSAPTGRGSATHARRQRRSSTPPAGTSWCTGPGRWWRWTAPCCL